MSDGERDGERERKLTSSLYLASSRSTNLVTAQFRTHHPQPPNNGAKMMKSRAP